MAEEGAGRRIRADVRAAFVIPGWLLRIRPVARGLTWLLLLRRLRPVRRGGTFRMVLSAVVDVVIYTVRPARAISPRSLFGETFTLPDSGDRFQVRAFTDDLYNILPGVEDDVETALLGGLRAGDVFVDVGANMGYYTIAAARRVGPEGLVVAVEAVPETADCLRRHVGVNEAASVRVVQAAVAAKGGEAMIGVPRGVYGTASLHAATGDRDTATFRVPAMRLDDVCAGLPRIRMLKLDIEGGEYDALAGGAETLRRTDAVVVECNRDAERIVELLEEAGFSVTPLRFTSYFLAERREAAATADAGSGG